MSFYRFRKCLSCFGKINQWNYSVVDLSEHLLSWESLCILIIPKLLWFPSQTTRLSLCPAFWLAVIVSSSIKSREVCQHEAGNDFSPTHRRTVVLTAQLPACNRQACRHLCCQQLNTYKATEKRAQAFRKVAEWKKKNPRVANSETAEIMCQTGKVSAEKRRGLKKTHQVKGANQPGWGCLLPVYSIKLMDTKQQVSDEDRSSLSGGDDGTRWIPAFLPRHAGKRCKKMWG